MDTLNHLIEKPINGKYIKLIKHVDTTLHMEIDTIPIRIDTDFDKYCMATSAIDYYNLHQFNMLMAFCDKSIETIVKNISSIVINEKKEEHKQMLDPFHIYMKFEEHVKVKIDYKDLEKKYNETLISLNNMKINIEIPKSILLTSTQSIQLIINEIKKINRNKSHDHYIVPDTNNPYQLHIYLGLSNLKQSSLHFILFIDPQRHPFYPPKLMYIVEPKLKSNLIISLKNLDILKYENWSPTIDLEYLIVMLAEQLDPIILQYIDLDNKSENHMKLEQELIALMTLTKETGGEQLIKLSIPKPTIQTQKVNDGKYWNSGTGYGTDDTTKNWDIKQYIQKQEMYNDEIGQCMDKINQYIASDTIEIILNSFLINYIVKQISGLTILELEKNHKLWLPMFNILSNLIGRMNEMMIINKISICVKPIYDELDMLVQANTIQSNELLLQVYSISKYYVNKYVEPIKEITVTTDNKEMYVMEMKKLQFGSAPINVNHRFYKNKTIKLEQKTVIRMLSEISSFKNNLPLNWESTIWVRVPKDNFNLFTFIISGPKDTPYENGLFEFHVSLPSDYPNGVPEVLLHTTGNNTVRFNPNLYNTGKVCLSLLGTWSGQEGEKWNPKTSTFLQVMVSIQSLILVEQPVFNEPGWERDMHTKKGEKMSADYNEEKQPHTISLGMTNMIQQPPVGYEEVVRLHFKMKKEEIINKTMIWEQQATKYKSLLQKNRNELIKLLETL
jgi:ubiquitin-protein ligase